MIEPIPKRITEDEYNVLMRQMWELKQQVAGFNNIRKHQEDIDSLYEQNRLIMHEQKQLRKMLVKIGLKLFQNATK